MDDRGNSGNNSGSQNLVTNMSLIVFFLPKVFVRIIYCDIFKMCNDKTIVKKSLLSIFCTGLESD